jgi:hypothetical protein
MEAAAVCARVRKAEFSGYRKRADPTEITFGQTRRRSPR